MSLFGGGASGGSTSTSSLFGGSKPGGAAGGSSGGGGLFGGGASGTTGTGGGGLFGSGGTSGGTATATAGGAAGGGLFGSGAGGSTTGMSASTGGLFGNKTTTTTSGGGLFGGGASSSTTTGGGLFGGGATTATTTSGGGLFGGGGAATTTTGGGLFGGGGSSFQQQQQQQLQQQQQHLLLQQYHQLQQLQVQQQVEQQLAEIVHAYDPSSARCRFKFMLYNVAEPGAVHRYVRPALTNAKMWEQAVLNNPDPSRLVPVQCTGWDELKIRCQQQDKQVEAHAAALRTIEGDVAAVESHYKVDTQAKIAKYRHKHMQLTARLLAVMRKLEVLQSRGYATVSQEVDFRTQLEELHRRLNADNMPRPRDLEALIADGRKADGLADSDAAGDRAQLSEAGFKQVLSVLTQMQDGLVQVMNVVKSDERDLAIMDKGLRAPYETHK